MFNLSFLYYSCQCCRYLASGCEAVIRLAFSKGFLVVTKWNTEHNHGLNLEPAVLTANQRYNKASELTKRLALVMSDCETQQFLQRHCLLQDILTMWEAGHEPSLADILPDPQPHA